MAIDKVYTVAFENVAISAIQDAFSLKAGATSGLEIRRIVLTGSAGNLIRLVLKRFPLASSVVQGTGGSALTPAAVTSRNTIAAAATAHINDVTTQMASSPSPDQAITLAAWQWTANTPFEEVPPRDGEPWEIAATEGIALNIPAAPTSTTVSGFILFRET